MTGTVYIVQAEGTPYFKIGVTTDRVGVRISGLQTGCPHKITLYASFPADKPRHWEQSLHRFYYPERVRGEWFEIVDLDQLNRMVGHLTYFANPMRSAELT